jgi:hypothetical protein
VVLGIKLRASHLLGRHSTTEATLPALFHVGCFWNRVSRTICQGWLWTVILLIFASWVARITSVSHPCPAQNSHLCSLLVHRCECSCRHGIPGCSMFLLSMLLAITFQGSCNCSCSCHWLSEEGMFFHLTSVGNIFGTCWSGSHSCPLKSGDASPESVIMDNIVL